MVVAFMYQTDELTGYRVLCNAINTLIDTEEFETGEHDED